MSDAAEALDRESVFTEVYEATYVDLVRFARRRLPVERADAAEDVAAEAFAVAWRRFGERPRSADDVRPWLFGIVRRLLLADHRVTSRQRALAVRLAERRTDVTTGDLDLAERRLDLARAWNLLTSVHQEALALSLLDDLPSAQAAVVLGISPVAYRLRLSRARRALRAHLDHAPATEGVLS